MVGSKVPLKRAGETATGFFEASLSKADIIVDGLRSSGFDPGSGATARAGPAAATLVGADAPPGTPVDTVIA